MSLTQLSQLIGTAKVVYLRQSSCLSAIRRVISYLKWFNHGGSALAIARTIYSRETECLLFKGEESNGGTSGVI
jgi:hypothetical protein